MNELIESIVNKQYTKADQLFHEAMNSIVSRKLNEAKKMCAAKMSVEQLNVDSQGNFHEAGGRNVILSHENQKRGLAEGDVKSIGTSHETENYTVSMGHANDAPVVVKHKSSGIKTRITHPDARAYVARISDKRKLTDSDVDNLKTKYKPVSMKEEAKKAALNIIHEKVRAKNVTPETIEAAQKHSDKTAKSKNPTSPEQFLPKKMGKNYSYDEKKVND